MRLVYPAGRILPYKTRVFSLFKKTLFISNKKLALQALMRIVEEY